jgi:AGZA family xanthine/uracil permease-like MFS transporter
MEKLFKLKENNTTVRTEVVAGITTFMAMAYILAVNPSILSAAGMDAAGVFVATALASCLGCLLMAFCANMPFGLAPGMGLNAYFAYTVVISMGYTWETALMAVFVEGIIFILLSVTNVREAIFNSIPLTLKRAISVGIGLFIALIGLLNANIVVADDSTTVALQSFSAENFHTEGICALLAVAGIVITAVMMIRNIKGGILWGILITWILGIACQLSGLYVVDAANGWYSMLPDFSNGFQLGAIKNVAFHLSLNGIHPLEFIGVVFAFLFVDLFDTLGTLIGVASKADMLDKEGRLPRIKGALMADAIATTAGAALGTSTTTTYAESATGVSEGGRTGLTALTIGILFALSVFLSPIFLAIPSFATAPALVMVGFYMMSAVLKIPFEDMAEAIPAYICMLAMPFFYSISDGIFLGVISYVVLNVTGGEEKRKRVSPLMIVLAVIFVLKYIFVR